MTSPGDMVRAEDIRWSLAPIARAEDVDVLTLTTAELLAYVADLQSETQSLRRVLHEAVALVARQQDQLRQAARVVEHQRQQLRRQREQAAA